MKSHNLAVLVIVAGCVFALGKFALKPSAVETTDMHTNSEWCGTVKKRVNFSKKIILPIQNLILKNPLKEKNIINLKVKEFRQL